MSLQLFNGKAGLRSHIEKDCPKATVVCNKCEQKLLREDESAHNCLPYRTKWARVANPHTLKAVLIEIVDQITQHDGKFETVNREIV